MLSSDGERSSSGRDAGEGDVTDEKKIEGGAKKPPLGGKKLSWRRKQKAAVRDGGFSPLSSAEEGEEGEEFEDDRTSLEVDAAAFLSGEVSIGQLDTLAGRRKTFQSQWRLPNDTVVTFPAEKLAPLEAEALAQAGFYFCPDEKKQDRCVCFCCNRALHTWDPNDNPLYEHCRWSPECPFVVALSTDNLVATEPNASFFESFRQRNTPAPTTKPTAAWTAQDGCNWPKDTVIDHLLICVHGVQVKESDISGYVETMRKNSSHVARKYMEERPMMMAVDAVDWHTVVSGAPKNWSRGVYLPVETYAPRGLSVTANMDTLEQITLGTVRAVRDMANDVCLDILYYTSPKYKYKILDAVAQLLNDKYRQYVETYPKFTGKVSLFCHSLGSVIAFDLMWAQKKERGVEMDDGVVGEQDKGKAGWRWPQLEFDIDNLFAVGSPVAMFLAVRGDVLSESWPRGPRPNLDFTLPGGARLFNIFHPADPIAYRFEPLLDSKYGQIPAALLPIRGTHAKGSTATHQPQTQTTATTTTKTSEQPHDAERNASETEKKVSEIADADGTDRIDIVLQKAASDGYSQYVSSLTFAAHWCYWDNKDIMLFVLDTIDRQQMSQDFFETETGRSWLAKCNHMLEKLANDSTAEELLKKGELFLQGAGKELMDHFLQNDSSSLMDMMHASRHHYPEANVLLREGIEKREILLKERLDHVAQVIKREDTKKLIQERRKDLQNPRSREDLLGSLKGQVLDLLMQYLSKLEVPPIVGTKEVGAGEFAYAIGSIVLSGVKIPSQTLILTISGKNVTVKATEVSAVLKNFTWLYKQKSFPWLKDRGTADAEVQGVSLWLNFDIEGLSGAKGGAPERRVSGKDTEKLRTLEAQNRVKIRKLDIKLHKAKASWLYNMLLAIFSQQVKVGVEEALTSVLHDKIGAISSTVLPRAEEYMELALRDGSGSGSHKDKLEAGAGAADVEGEGAASDAGPAARDEHAHALASEAVAAVGGRALNQEALDQEAQEAVGSSAPREGAGGEVGAESGSSRIKLPGEAGKEQGERGEKAGREDESVCAGRPLANRAQPERSAW